MNQEFVNRWLKGVTMAAALAAVAAVLWLSTTPVATQTTTRTAGAFPPYKAPRLAGTTNPDLNGVWQALNTANIDIEAHNAEAGPYPELLGAYGAFPGGQSIIEGGTIPYQPWALEKRKQNRDNRMKVDLSSDLKWHETGDPEMKCYMPGIPRASYMPFPFQIIQGNTPYVLIAYEFGQFNRIVRMNWKQESPEYSWMGWSRGRWEGDTLVVDVTGLRKETWLDRAGNFHTEDLHVVERFTPVSPYHLMYEATLEDPKVYTRPWKISFPLYRRAEANAQILEFRCQPFTEELLYGPFKKK